MLTAARTLEDRLTQIAELVAANRAVNWEIGDEAAKLVEEYGRKIIGKIAEVCGWRKSQVLHTIELSVVFPPEVRYPDVRRSQYSAALKAAKRLEQEPIAVLEDALARGLSASQIGRLGRGSERAILRAVCDCGIRLRIEGPGVCEGTTVICPSCGVNLGVMYLG